MKKGKGNGSSNVKALLDRTLVDSSVANGAREGVFAALISEGSIRGLAGDVYYQRGHDYFKRGRVSFLEESGACIRSVVDGTERYSVLLTADGTVLDHDCECPLGDDGEFCKHCVATALAWLHGQVAPAAGAGKKSRASAEITDEDVVGALQAEEKDALIQLLIDWSERDKALRERLMLLAAGRKGGGVLLARVRRVLEQAIRIRGFVDYREMPGYAARVDAAIDAVEGMLMGGQAEGVIEVCEVGVRKLVDAIGNTDDSDGSMSGLMGRLERLHLRACVHARPDPAALARRLFSLELEAEYDEWSQSAEKYAGVLGEKGLEVFRTLAGAEWAKVSVRTEKRSYGEEEDHYRLTGIMESMARQSGDVEQLVAVLERDLSSAHQYLRIAVEYRNAGKYDKALAWAERGAAATSGYDGAALRVFVAEEYQRDERHADALRMIWIEFRNGPDFASYKLLRSFARRADEWDDWRERALAHIRRTIAGRPVEARDDGSMVSRWRDRKLDHSLLVEIFLDEGKTEDAWREGQAGGCREALWLRLAEERRKTYPEDAARVYLRLGEEAVARVQNGRYEVAIQLLERAAALLHSLGKGQEFEAMFEALRLKYKVKRNLQKLAEERRRFLYLS